MDLDPFNIKIRTYILTQMCKTHWHLSVYTVFFKFYTLAEPESTMKFPSIGLQILIQMQHIL